MSDEQLVPIDAVSVLALVKAKIDSYGGAKKASEIWGCSAQMVFLVLRGERRPTPKMLAEVDVREIKSEITYSRIVR